MDILKISHSDEFDIVGLISAIEKKRFLILIAGVLCGSIAFAYSSYRTIPLYRARSTMLVDLRNSLHDSITSERLNLAEKLSTTIRYIMKTSFLLEPIIESFKNIDGKMSGVVLTHHDPKYAGGYRYDKRYNYDSYYADAK